MSTLQGVLCRLALAMALVSPGIANASPTTVTARANVSSSVTLAFVSDLGCGTLAPGASSCNPLSTGYQPGQVTLQSNSTWLLSTIDNTGVDGASQVNGDFVTVVNGNTGSYLQIQFQTSAVTGGATAGGPMAITFTPTAVFNNTSTIPDGLYVGSFTVTVASTYVP